MKASIKLVNGFLIFFLIFSMNNINYTNAQNYIAAVGYQQTPPVKKNNKTKFSNRKKFKTFKQKKKIISTKNNKNRKIKVGRVLLIVGLSILGLGLIVVVLGYALVGGLGGTIIAFLGGLLGVVGLALTIAGAITMSTGKREERIERSRPVRKVR